MATASTTGLRTWSCCVPTAIAKLTTSAVERRIATCAPSPEPQICPANLRRGRVVPRPSRAPAKYSRLRRSLRRGCRSPHRRRWRPGGCCRTRTAPRRPTPTSPRPSRRSPTRPRTSHPGPRRLRTTMSHPRRKRSRRPRRRRTTRQRTMHRPKTTRTHLQRSPRLRTKNSRQKPTTPPRSSWPARAASWPWAWPETSSTRNPPRAAGRQPGPTRPRAVLGRASSSARGRVVELRLLALHARHDRGELIGGADELELKRCLHGQRLVGRGGPGLLVQALGGPHRVG